VRLWQRIVSPEISLRPPELSDATKGIRHRKVFLFMKLFLSLWRVVVVVAAAAAASE
jgi:hypothetical protein